MGATALSRKPRSGDTIDDGLRQACLDGSRLPIVIAVTLTGALTLFALPALFLVYVEAYRAACDDAAREPLAS